MTVVDPIRETSRLVMERLRGMMDFSGAGDRDNHWLNVLVLY